MSTSTLRWVTTDGISGGDVTVTVGLNRAGTGGINGIPGVTGVGTKGGVGNSLVVFDVTMTATGTNDAIPGTGTIHATVALTGTGSKGATVGGFIADTATLTGAGVKGALGTYLLALSAVIHVFGSGTGTPAASDTFVLSGGGDGHAVGLPLVPDGFTLPGGGDGSFVLSPNLVIYKVRLVYDGVVDDHERPRHRLWSRFMFPPTQKALLLWRDGTVQETSELTEIDLQMADDIIAGGHPWVGDPECWQAQVLTAAGFMLETVTEG